MQNSQKSTKALEEIEKALSHIKWGSIEIFLQNGSIVQITERNIKKLSEESKKVGRNS